MQGAVCDEPNAGHRRCHDDASEVVEAQKAVGHNGRVDLQGGHPIQGAAVELLPPPLPTAPARLHQLWHCQRRLFGGAAHLKDINGAKVLADAKPHRLRDSRKETLRPDAVLPP